MLSWLLGNHSPIHHLVRTSTSPNVLPTSLFSDRLLSPNILMRKMIMGFCLWLLSVTFGQNDSTHPKKWIMMGNTLPSTLLSATINVLSQRCSDCSNFVILILKASYFSLCAIVSFNYRPPPMGIWAVTGEAWICEWNYAIAQFELNEREYLHSLRSEKGLMNPKKGTQKAKKGFSSLALTSLEWSEHHMSFLKVSLMLSRLLGNHSPIHHLVRTSTSPNVLPTSLFSFWYFTLSFASTK